MELAALLPTPLAGLGIVLVGLAAGIIRGLTGFGTALVMVPGLSLFLAPEQAVVTTMVAMAITNLPMVPSARADAHLPTVGWFLLGCAPALPLGVYVLEVLPAAELKTLIGVTVIGASLLLAAPRLRLHGAGAVTKLAAGFVSGVMNGAVAMGGPPVVLLLLALPVPAATVRANLILYFTPLNAITVLVFAVQGLIDARTLVWSAILIPPLVLSSRWGEALFRGGWSARYRPLAIGVLVMTGIAALLG